MPGIEEDQTNLLEVESGDHYSISYKLWFILVVALDHIGFCVLLQFGCLRGEFNKVIVPSNVE